VLDDAVADSRIGGAVFGMVREGKLAFLQAVGYRDTAKTERMRPDAIFPLASMTKPIASVAAMILVERARMLLTDPIERFLPAFRDAKVLTTYGLEPTRLPITLLDLLRWTRKIGQEVKLGLLLRRTDLNDGQTEAVFGGIQGEGCS
jgi:CubicO group peptidase (beta-lactamase class C family)